MLAESYDQLKLIFRRDGIKVLIYRIVRKLLGVKGEIAAARAKVANHLLKTHDGTVAYGPFAGMRLSQDVWWGRYDVSAKILGTYERQVVDLIVQWSASRWNLFIDIGAADGYFAVGVLKAGLFPRVHAFEISERGRESLEKNARNNGVLGRMTIAAEADHSSLASALESCGSAVILIDIEGSECDLLDERTLTLLRSCAVVVELHPWRTPHGQQRQRRLIESSERYFHTGFLNGAGVDAARFPELSDFTDDERLLAFSEGRSRSMQWLVLTPRDSHPC